MEEFFEELDFTAVAFSVLAVIASIMWVIYGPGMEDIPLFARIAIPFLSAPLIYFIANRMINQ